MVQRVRRASVSVDGAVVGEVDAGVCILLGVGPADTEAEAVHLAERIATLRIHADDDGKMNRDLHAAGGGALVISQFTLYADTSRGHRPSFIGAGPPALGTELCDAFVAALRARGLSVATGVFGAHMEVEIINDGPVTVVMATGESGWGSDAG